ncbi:unnamed protein product [Eretmochelys imbricata]
MSRGNTCSKFPSPEEVFFFFFFKLPQIVFPGAEFLLLESQPQPPSTLPGKAGAPKTSSPLAPPRFLGGRGRPGPPGTRARLGREAEAGGDTSSPGGTGGGGRGCGPRWRAEPGRAAGRPAGLRERQPGRGKTGGAKGAQTRAESPGQVKGAGFRSPRPLLGPASGSQRPSAPRPPVCPELYGTSTPGSRHDATRDRGEGRIGYGCRHDVRRMRGGLRRCSIEKNLGRGRSRGVRRRRRGGARLRGAAPSLRPWPLWIPSFAGDVVL